MVRTIVIRVDVGAARLEQIGEVTVNVLDDRLTEKAASHARLIRDHYHAQPRAIQRAHGVDAPRIQRHAIDAIQIADLLDERAVAIEKDGGPKGLP